MRKRLAWLVMAAGAGVSACGNTIELNTAGSFGLLGDTISNTGTSVVVGDVGATTTITGFPPGTTVGGSVIPAGSATNDNAYTDFLSAFNAGETLPSTQTYADLTVNRTFVGNNVYTFSSPNISTTTGIDLTFDARNNPNAIFVIRVAGSFTENGALTFTLENGAQADNIFWITGGAATISVGSSGPITWDGNILSRSSFTMSAASGGSGVLAGTINGCVLATTANTLAGETNVNGCSSSIASIPEPGSFELVGLGCLLGILASENRRGRLWPFSRPGDAGSGRRSM